MEGICTFSNAKISQIIVAVSIAGTKNRSNHLQGPVV